MLNPKCSVGDRKTELAARQAIIIKKGGKIVEDQLADLEEKVSTVSTQRPPNLSPRSHVGVYGCSRLP